MTLKTDSTPLTATAVSLKAGATNVEVQAPLQPIKAGAGQITLLGLTVDASGAGLAGSDDSDATTQPIDASELISGQVVEVQLVSNAVPLVATELDVKNFGNQVELSTEDGRGHPVNDVDAHGNPVDDVQVDVVQTVPVLSSVPAAVPTPLTYYGVPIGPAPATTSVTHESKHLRLHAGSNGKVTVSGLATGQATILITRVHGGVTTVARRRVAVKANTHRSVHLRLQEHASR